MKKSNFLLLLVVLFMACDGDSDNNNLINELLGTWEADFGSISDCDDFDDNRPLINYVPCTDPPCWQMVFYESMELDYNFHSTTSSYRELEGTFELKGKKLTLCVPPFSDCFTYTVEIDGNSMVLTSTSETTGCVGVTNLIRQL